MNPNEIAQRDGNGRPSLLAVTDDSNQYVKAVKVNPLTGAILVTSNGTPSTTDGKVFVDAQDTTRDFLFSKLSAGNNVYLSVINVGGNEKVQISSNGGSYLLEFNTLAQLDAYKATSTSSFTFLVSSIGYIGIYSITSGEFAIAGNR